MNSEIIYKKGISLIGCILLIAGIIIVYAQTLLDVTATSAKLALMLVGAVCILVGLVKLLMGKKYIIYQGSGSKVKNMNLFFDSHEINKLQGLLESKQFEYLQKLKPAEGNKAGVRLDLLVSEDKKFAAAQVFQFIPFKYEPASDLINFYDEDAATLSKYIPAQ
ncbi:hypothetical protein [Coprobacter tertius]|uniref:Transmembrane protein n=1 Tax=Coprobacter tertius TaxID=2944915 RepID=A0ABT1MI82_9BACT|nr:hypothetical protein [Coprobacter tertius]MCP9612330.1 hypothetical protein [Coprobacter tertius]